MHVLIVDYDEGNTKSYKGVCIKKFEDSGSVELVRSNVGDLILDENKALDMLGELVGEVEVYYNSSYDNFLQDLDLENDPKLMEYADKIYEQLLQEEDK